MKTTKILIIEDDQSMASALKLGFEHEGYAVQIARDGADGLHCALKAKADLLILDVMLPKMSGLDLCKQLRASGDKRPIIMLTARGQELDKVVGLKVGADDYITKPFSFLELMARVEAVLRRSLRTSILEAYEFDDIRLDFKMLTATKEGRRLDLSVRELNLRRVLIVNRDTVVTREQLLSEVWGYEHFTLTRTIDTHISKL